MIQNYSRWRVLQVFFDDPVPKEGFTIRWISRHIGLAPTSVKLHLDELSREDDGYPLVTRSEGRSYATYRANRNNEAFRFYKKMDMIVRIRESGLLEFLSYKCSPSSVILFGSAARGEDVMGSDIDIFVESVEKHLDLKEYENKLKRPISLHFSESLNKFPKELRNNIINGIILEGYLKVF
ncbi:MAG: nucleotidyltransferase domain-containing protein [Candidatus Aenigmatarchaeota archaeon]